MAYILCFAAHPDDLEFSCTGTVKKLRELGHRIVYIIVTNGENGFKMNHSVSREERIQIRKAEQEAAANKLGIEHLIFLGFPDGALEYSLNFRNQVAQLIKKFKPQIIFSFDPANRSFTSLNVMHRDHRVLAEVVFDACLAAKNMYMLPGEPHRIDQIYFYASEQPNHFVDITTIIDFKLEVLACHRSQFPDFTKVENYIKNEVSKQTELFTFSEAFRVMNVRQIT